MDFFTLREREIFATLRSLAPVDFVLIGGYAVNAYVRARYSVDCDVVIATPETDRTASILEGGGFRLKTRNSTGGPYSGAFMSFEKNVSEKSAATFDVLVNEVLDRRTRASFSADWISRYSGLRRLPAKSYPDSHMLRIVDPDALAVMKLVAGRVSDLRDVFMLAPSLDLGFVRSELAKRENPGDVFSNASKIILSDSFRNNLQGVFGFVDEKAFQKHRKAFEELVGIGPKRKK